MTIGETIKDLRKTNHLTQTDLANALGYDQAEISRIEGKNEVSSSFLLSAAKFFNVSTDYLLGLTEVKSQDINTRAICEEIGFTEKSVEILRHVKKLTESPIIPISQNCSETLAFLNKLCSEEFGFKLQEIGKIKTNLFSYLTFSYKQYDDIVNSTNSNDISQSFYIAEENAKSVFLSLFELSKLFEKMQNIYAGDLFSQWEKMRNAAQEKYNEL